MPSIERQIEIGLFGTSRKSSRWSGTHPDMDHDRCLDDPSETHSLRHERKPSARGRDNRSRSSIPSPETLVDRRNFILSLIHHHTKVLPLLSQKGEQSRPRRHRVRRNIVTPSRERPESECGHSIEEELVFDRIMSTNRHFDTGIIGDMSPKGIALFGCFEVLRDYFFTLTSEALLEVRLED